MPLQPRRPAHIPDYAELCLHALAEQGLGDKISLGGAFGLLHYLDYRDTHDVDAWWTAESTPEAREQVIATLQDVLQPFGQVRVRAWGEVASVELIVAGKAVFSFQVAQRSAQLQPSIQAPWTAVQLDSLPDLIASKMVALVERGAPRDLRDIYTICQAKLASPAECWQLWRVHQQLARSDSDFVRARLAVETHLARIARQRPLTQIVDPDQRAQAEQVRNWYKSEFLDVNLD
jgi:hypothetical protein